MTWANVENTKILATPNAQATCPSCGEKVFSKCGEIKVWHWSHFKRENCDAWYEPESFWHMHWKMSFGKENAEIVIKKDGKRHVADILTDEKVVIELQNSSISIQKIREREDFYGEKMLWLINGEKFKENLSPKDIWEDQDYLEMKSLPRPPVRWERINPEVKKGIDGEFFNWKFPLESWKEVRRPVFIDFGEDLLFHVKEGMGTFQIRGTYVHKEKFMKKYGGNYEYYCQQKPPI